jgi:hypothetical protein
MGGNEGLHLGDPVAHLDWFNAAAGGQPVLEATGGASGGFARFPRIDNTRDHGKLAASRDHCEALGNALHLAIGAIRQMLLEKGPNVVGDCIANQIEVPRNLLQEDANCRSISSESRSAKVTSKLLPRGKAVQVLENAETRTGISRDVNDTDLLASS